MRFDLSPLYRSTVGFDSLASMLDQVADLDNEAATYPPYNIERLTENEYRITMAVAGFGKQDVEIEVKENTLSIRGEKKEADKEIAERTTRIAIIVRTNGRGTFISDCESRLNGIGRGQCSMPIRLPSTPKTNYHRK